MKCDAQRKRNEETRRREILLHRIKSNPEMLMGINRKLVFVVVVAVLEARRVGLVGCPTLVVCCFAKESCDAVRGGTREEGGNAVAWQSAEARHGRRQTLQL